MACPCDARQEAIILCSLRLTRGRAATSNSDTLLPGVGQGLGPLAGRRRPAGGQQSDRFTSGTLRG